MKKQTLLLILMFITTLSFGQANSKKNLSQALPQVRDSIVSDWVGILETRTEQEAHCAIVICNGQKKVLLMFYNEWYEEKTITVKITVKYLGYVISKESTLTLKVGQREKGDCKTKDNKLFIDLPLNWQNLDKVVVEAKQIF